MDSKQTRTALNAQRFKNMLELRKSFPDNEKLRDELVGLGEACALNRDAVLADPPRLHGVRFDIEGPYDTFVEEIEAHLDGLRDEVTYDRLKACPPYRRMRLHKMYKAAEEHDAAKEEDENSPSMVDNLVSLVQGELSMALIGSTVSGINLGPLNDIANRLQQKQQEQGSITPDAQMEQALGMMQELVSTGELQPMLEGLLSDDKSLKNLSRMMGMDLTEAAKEKDSLDLDEAKIGEVMSLLGNPENMKRMQEGMARGKMRPEDILDPETLAKLQTKTTDTADA